MKKILITGASGLLGKAVLRQLKGKEEYEAYAVTTDAGRLKDYKYVHPVVCNLTVEEQRETLLRTVQPDILLHLAWNQADASFRMSPANLQWLDISMSLLYLFEQYGGKRFLFAGSSSEYDGAEGVFREDTPAPPPASLYGLSKRTFNEFACEYCRRRGIGYAGMRFFTIYGAEDEHSFGAIPSAVCKLKRNEQIVCSSPETTRDYIYVEDAAKIAVRLLGHSFTGIVNVASGKAQTMREVFQCIGEAMGKSQYVKMSENPSEGKRFEADIRLLKSLGLYEGEDEFKNNIKNCILRKRGVSW